MTHHPKIHHPNLFNSTTRIYRERRSAPRETPDRRERRRVGEEDTTPAELKAKLDANLPLINAEGNSSRGYQVLKRTFDLVGAATLVVLLSPILLATLVALTITTKGRPVFIQQRIGYLGKKFPMIKFRTMRLDADKVQHLVQNQHHDGPIFKNKVDPRITKLGRILRKTSIDELPQLFNVLAGHMSLVGPRPPIEKEVVQYKVWQRRRLAIKPGLTCLWQVSGRSEVGFENWVRMDIWYSKNQTFWTDLWLLVKTPWTVITGRGAY
jgi:lipopolysaccharide/colanic/teichoic acid biosynthesis glycosyltransferase